MHMENSLGRRGLLVAGASFALSATTSAFGQSVYPERPVKLIVPFPPGGGADFIARSVQVRLSERLKQPVIIENHGGAGGTLGAAVAAKAAADGYTLTIGNVATHSIAPSVYPKLSYHPVRDFVAVAPVAAMPHILSVHPSLGVSTVQELIALVKAKPDTISYASAGNGSVGHLAMELFKSMAGLRIQHVPYKGSGPALADVASGHVQLLFDSLAGGLSLVKAGTLRGLAVSSAKRTSAAPQLPTLAESGVPGYEVSNWFGVFVPVNTPAAIVQRLNADVTALTSMPEVRDGFRDHGADVMTATPQEFEIFVKAEVIKWEKVVRESGLKIE